MPKRDDIQTILVLGAGPIVIGQGCEFDYSGSQACQVLKAEGYRIVLVNSNPATIMTDDSLADATYIEAVEWQTVAKIIEKEKPDAILPTVGGQTALNCALDLDKHGILAKFNVTMLGANKESIDKAEDRQLFAKAMAKIGLSVPNSGLAHSMAEANAVAEKLGFPLIIRPSFTLGGSGGGIAYNREEFETICRRGLELSPTTELLIDESIIGWKEYELEVVRDRNDNCIIICSIENIDPMGVHTGDSITVAPAQTLTDKEYQFMRDAAIKILREIGVDTGGSNVQFAVNPTNGEVVVIEMNPRVSRSSALASKATGFPIAKVAAKLAVGYTLDELANDITGGSMPASFEPTIDYVVTKIPRFNFEKFPKADSRLTTQMKSVGEVMALGRNFQESFQKAIRGLEVGFTGLDPVIKANEADVASTIRQRLIKPSWQRLWYVAEAFRYGMDLDEVAALTGMDPWFLAEIADLMTTELTIADFTVDQLDAALIRSWKRKGFSDQRLATLLTITEQQFRVLRQQYGIHPCYKRVDTCAGEFDSDTAYLYSSYDEECEARPTTDKKIMVLGGGPNRIGQGIEFDYCCVHAVKAIRALGYQAIMVNCNPETVSTDYDTADRLYFEPITLENVLDIVDVENPDGVILQYGGQTPLKLAKTLAAAGVNIIGTSPESIARAEDRGQFQALVKQLDLLQPPSGLVRSVEEGLRLAKVFAYPLMVRPSFVLGGRAMAVIHGEADFADYLNKAEGISVDSPLLLDHFLNQAIEVDVDAVCDGQEVVIAGVMEHIEQAGIHSGDSSCCLPPHSLSAELQTEIVAQMTLLAKALNVVGLMNAQFAIQNEQIFILEVNPRASRTVPFVAKASGYPWAQIAARCMLGVSLAEQKITQAPELDYYFVKQPVFPFVKFPGVDPVLGPEMRSTGEVMGVGRDFGEAYLKAQVGAGKQLARQGKVFISVHDQDKPHIAKIAQDLADLGFKLVVTRGTSAVLRKANIEHQVINKVIEGQPHIVDAIKNDDIDYIINTAVTKYAILDSETIRCSAVEHDVCYNTTLAGGRAVVMALANRSDYQVVSLQELYANQQLA